MTNIPRGRAVSPFYDMPFALRGSGHRYTPSPPSGVRPGVRPWHRRLPQEVKPVTVLDSAQVSCLQHLMAEVRVGVPEAGESLVDWMEHNIPGLKLPAIVW